MQAPARAGVCAFCGMVFRTATARAPDRGLVPSIVSFRLRAFLAHLGASLFLLTVVLGGLYLGWYRWPGWYLMQADMIAGILVMVDAGLGPLATLVVSSPTKARSVWRRDMVVIVAIQLLGLGYGAHTLWAARPLYYAYYEDRIVVVPASDFRPKTLAVARRAGLPEVPDWQSLPKWIWTPLPTDPEEWSRLSASILSGGEDVTAMPRYFRPWEQGVTALRAHLLPLGRLAELPNEQQEPLRHRIQGLGVAPDRLGMLPARGLRRDGMWVFDRTTGQPLAFWPVEIWSLKKSRH